MHLSPNRDVENESTEEINLLTSNQKLEPHENCQVNLDRNSDKQIMNSNV